MKEARLPAGRAQAQIAEAATTLQLLPDLHIVRYYGHVAQADTGLYSRLRQEWVMEREVQQLAVEITLMPSGPERDAKVESLHRRLDAIFERKLDNRRLEIGQLRQPDSKPFRKFLGRKKTQIVAHSMEERRLDRRAGPVRPLTKADAARTRIQPQSATQTPGRTQDLGLPSWQQRVLLALTLPSVAQNQRGSSGRQETQGVTLEFKNLDLTRL